MSVLYPASLIIALTLPGAPKSDRPTYPDLSEPYAAAFALTSALIRGDAKTARSIYIGDDKEFFKTIDTFATRAIQIESFRKAAIARYGKSVVAAVSDELSGFSVGWIPRLKRRTIIFSLTLLEQKGEGNQTRLIPEARFEDDPFFGGSEIRLKKVGNDWKVTKYPALSDVLPFMQAEAAVYGQLAHDVGQGKHKAHKLADAFSEMMNEQPSVKAIPGGGGGVD